MTTEPRNTRQRILDAAIDRFATRGFHETSMRDIASAVGIKAASLYSHFENKEAILRAILEDYEAEIAKLRLPDAQLEQIVADYPPETILVEGFKFIRKGVSAPRTERILRLVFNEMFRNPKVGEFGLDWIKKRNLRELTRTFAAMQRRGKMKAVDPAFVSVLYNALINSYFHELFVRKACDRDTRNLERDTLRHFEQLARLLSDDERPAEGRPSDRSPGGSSCSKS